MQCHWVFNDCDNDLKRQIRVYLEQKQPRLDRILRHFQPDLLCLTITVYRHSSPRRFEIRAALHLPLGSIVVEETQKDFETASDRVADSLARESNRYVERLRQDSLQRRKGRRREKLDAIAPFLHHDVQCGRSTAFFDLLRPELESLYDHARRELYFLELEGVVPKGELTPAELADEVLVQAWHRFRHRPRHKPLDLWLVEILHECLKTWYGEPTASSLAWRGRVQERRLEETEADGDWITEDMELEDLVPGVEGTERWNKLESEEQREKLLALLAKLPKSQRQALVPNALEGFDSVEIAMIQDRSKGDVSENLDTARRTLRLQLAKAGYIASPILPELIEGEEKTRDAS